MTENDNRCWPGYEPVKGKPAHSEGSCRPKAESKTSTSEKKFRAKRRSQLDKWETEHKGTRKQGSQHLSASDPKKKTKTNAETARPKAKRAVRPGARKSSASTKRTRSAARKR